MEIEKVKAEGAIIRSKVKFIEEGERRTQYFFGLEKFNYIKKHIWKLILDNGKVVTTNEEILKETLTFYEKLYKAKKYSEEEDNWDFLYNESIPKLNRCEKGMCDEEITENECYVSLSSFKNNKSPGNDGLTKEFYASFWEKISKPLLECYKYSQEVGCLSNSQRQAIITLLEKHGKDRSYLENWRPISLLNLDYKLLTKVLANRVKRVLPLIVENCQTGYVKDRSISDSIRLIQDIIHYTEITQSPGVLLTVDFKKAFDSIDWKFIIEALKRYDFGPVLINWVNIVYTDISSCIYNNGTTSKYFSLYRGVRQGDPLSPYLFIIAVDILARNIINEKKIKGIQIKAKEIKITQYADDLTLMFSDMRSINETLSLLQKFGECSGLKINKGKTTGMLLGSWKNRRNLPQIINWTKYPIKLLGIFISNNSNETVMTNFESKVEALLRQLHWWKARDLSLRGKVLIVKALALSKFQYLASVVTIPEHIIRQVNSMVYEFK